MRLVGLTLLFVLLLAPVGISIYGLYLAFSASIALGIIALIVEPSPFIIGLLMIFVDYNLPQAIIDYVK